MLASACTQTAGSGQSSSGGKVERPTTLQDAAVAPPRTGSVQTATVSRTPSMTRAQWDVARYPRDVATHVQTRGCEPSAIDSESRVLPNVACALASDYDVETNPVRDCIVEPYCVGPEDCTDGLRGRCEGLPSPARCIYPATDDEACTTDADCSRLGRGHCEHTVTSDFLCYPTGECSPPGDYCSYDSQPCDTNADCNLDEGGRCLAVIEYAECTYDECTDDGQCGQGQRCACFNCVHATCSSDSDCDAAQSCKMSTVCGRPDGFACTTPDDECIPGDSECDCAFANGRFSCSQRRCE
jgi:hypothetical protein